MTTKMPSRGHSVRGHVLGTAAICALAGLMNYLVRGQYFWLCMAYSFAIGSQISIWISLLTAGVSRLLTRWQGETPELREGWVGWGWTLPCVAVSSFLGYSGGVLLTNTLTGLKEPLPWEMAGGRAAITVGFALAISLLGTLAFFSVFRLNGLRLAQAQAQQQAAEARLTLLQSQLEPHMLFNTLAHLRVLIKLRPDEAQRMLDRLIDYLRATLLASRATEHPLADEFARLADYLALMHLRMGERLRVALDLPPELAGIAIPPLLLQPLVENAIKHGLEPHVDGGELHVTASRAGDRLVLAVADSGVGLAAPNELAAVGTGFGLSQVRERLAQRYGDAARFDLQPHPGGGSVARIEIPAP